MAGTQSVCWLAEVISRPHLLLLVTLVVLNMGPPPPAGEEKVGTYFDSMLLLCEIFFLLDWCLLKQWC